MKRRAALRGTLALGSAIGWTSRALADPNVRGEIDQLLEFIRQTGCKFNRNGSWYPGSSAHTHIRDKYLAALAAGEIMVAEDFIEKVASRSSFSGQAYTVQCGGGATIPTSEWLGAELARLRAAARIIRRF